MKTYQNYRCKHRWVLIHNAENLSTLQQNCKCFVIEVELDLNKIMFHPEELTLKWTENLKIFSMYLAKIMKRPTIFLPLPHLYEDFLQISCAYVFKHLFPNKYQTVQFIYEFNKNTVGNSEPFLCRTRDSLLEWGGRILTIIFKVNHYLSWRNSYQLVPQPTYVYYNRPHLFLLHGGSKAVSVDTIDNCAPYGIQYRWCSTKQLFIHVFIICTWWHI